MNARLQPKKIMQMMDDGTLWHRSLSTDCWEIHLSAKEVGEVGCERVVAEVMCEALFCLSGYWEREDASKMQLNQKL